MDILVTILNYLPYVPLAFILIGLFRGLTLGWKRACIKFVVYSCLVVALYFVITPITEMIIPLLVEIQEIRELVILVSDLNISILIGILNPIVYVVSFFIGKILVDLILLIIFSITKVGTKLDERGKRKVTQRFLGILPGILIGALTALIIFIPINGFLKDAPKFIEMLPEEMKEEFEPIVEPINNYNKNPLVEYLFKIQEPIYRTLTNGIIDEAVEITNEFMLLTLGESTPEDLISILNNSLFSDIKISIVLDLGIPDRMIPTEILELPEFQIVEGLIGDLTLGDLSKILDEMDFDDLENNITNIDNILAQVPEELQEAFQTLLEKLVS